MKRLARTTVWTRIALMLFVPISGFGAQNRDLYSKKSIRELVQDLKVSDKRIRRLVINELLERTPTTQEDRDSLLGALGKGDSEAETSVMLSLAKAKERRAVPQLIDRLNDRNTDIQEAAIESLAEIGDDAALKPLAGTLDRQFHFGRPHPIWKFGAKALPYIVNKADNFRGAQMTAKRNAASLLRNRAIAETIGAIRDRGAISELITLLKHESPEIRMNAAKALAAMKVKEADTEMEKLLADTDENVKIRALGILLPTDRARFLPFSLKFIKEGRGRLRDETIDLLGAHKVSEATPHLENLLTHSDDLTRYHAARALRNVTGKDYPYKKTPQTEDMERGEKEWGLLRQGKSEEAKKYARPNKESEAEGREMVEKLRKAGLLAPEQKP